MKFVVVVKTKRIVKYIMKMFSSVGMPFLGFLILVRETKYTNYDEIVNHEKIHLIQQREMLIVFWRIFYILQFLYFFLIKNFVLLISNVGKDFWQSYMELTLEKEAYEHENNIDYLEVRKPYAWINFMNFKKNKQ